MRKSHVSSTLIRKVPLILVLIALLTSCGPSGRLSIGDRAPTFTLPTSTGGEVALTDYVGEKPVLLYFHMAVG